MLVLGVLLSRAAKPAEPGPRRKPVTLLLFSARSHLYLRSAGGRGILDVTTIRRT